MSNLYIQIVNKIQPLLACQRKLDAKSPILLNETINRCFRDLLIMIHEYQEIDPEAEQFDLLMIIKGRLDGIRATLIAATNREANSYFLLQLCKSLVMLVEDRATQCFENDFTIKKRA